MSPKIALGLAVAVVIAVLAVSLATGNWLLLLGWAGGCATGWSALVAVRQMAHPEPTQ